MLCRWCAELVRQWDPQLIVALGRVPGRSRLGRVLCSRCGALPLADVPTHERLVDKLYQLARFGLVGSAPPLLKASSPGATDR